MSLEQGKFFQVAEDNRVVAGIAAFLAMKNSSGKYSLLMPLATIPSISGTPEAIEFDVTTSPSIGKLEGKTTLEEKEVDFYLHRDSANILEKMKGKVGEFMTVYPDFTARKFTGSVSYTPQDAVSSDPLKGTFKITPKTDDGYVANAYDLIQKTCLFRSEIPATVFIEGTGTYEVAVELSESAGTFTAVSGTTSVATVTKDTDKITITGVAKGSAIITLVSNATGQASWQTTILVIVE